MKKKLLLPIIAIFFAIVIYSLFTRFTNRECTQRQPNLKKLTTILSVINSMMYSTNKIVYLNLLGIGESDNYLCFTPTTNGILMRYPVYDNRQSKFVDRLKQSCLSYEIASVVIPDTANDVYEKGTNYTFTILGTSELVSGTIIGILTNTFDIQETTTCDFDYVDF